MASVDIPDLPSHVKHVLVTGGGGYVGREVAKLLQTKFGSALKITLADLNAPQPLGNAQTVSGDLSDPSQVAKLFEGEQVDAIMAFQGIMSGGSEANFDLGYKVNVDSHHALLEAARKESAKRTDGKKVIYVYISGLAVYGGDKCLPADFVVPEVTPLFPETSYGTAKAITELYVFDYTRKGFVDGRILRLPTVAIRAGAPSSAASSFISGMIREPLQGLPSECPVASGPEDPAMDTVPIYLSRASTVFRNIAYALTMDQTKFPKFSRTVNVPGITVTPRQIVDALEAVGGKKALDLVTYKKDEAVMHIMSAWPGAFDNTAAIALGFVQDDPKTGFMAAVKDFKDGLSK
ncbi:NAD(P)-binding protein [Meredithblackwellia eburnea MCA 4105]